MFSFQEYLLGWGVYLFSVIGLLCIYWRMTCFIGWRYLRDCIRLLGAVFLLLPITIEDTHYWAPAWVSVVLNIIFSELDAVWPIARLFLLILLASYLVYFVLLFIAVGAGQLRAKLERRQG